MNLYAVKDIGVFLEKTLFFIHVNFKVKDFWKIAILAIFISIRTGLKIFLGKRFTFSTRSVAKIFFRILMKNFLKLFCRVHSNREKMSKLRFSSKLSPYD